MSILADELKLTNSNSNTLKIKFEGSNDIELNMLNQNNWVRRVSDWMQFVAQSSLSIAINLVLCRFHFLIVFLSLLFSISQSFERSSFKSEWRFATITHCVTACDYNKSHKYNLKKKLA